MSKNETQLYCRKAKSDDDAFNIGRLLVEMAKEVARCEMSKEDYNAAFATIHGIVEDGLAYLVADDSGLVVASLGLFLAHPWYSPRASFFVEKWFYVLPHFRGGIARKMLEDEAMRLSDERQMPVYLKYFDPDKMKETARKLYVGEEKGYIPTGRFVRFNPSGVIVTEG